MAQSTILALGTTKATSTDVTIAAGATNYVGIFSDVRMDTNAKAVVYIDTPSIDNVFAVLDSAKPQIALVGPAVFRITRQECGTNVGIWLDA